MSLAIKGKFPDQIQIELFRLNSELFVLFSELFELFFLYDNYIHS